MRAAVVALLLAACGPKTPPADAGDAAEAQPEAAAAPEAAPEPEPEPEPAVVSNVDFNATVTYADGTTKSGHVIRLERSDDWYADAGWLDDERKLIIYGTQGSTEKEFSWDDIARVTVKPGSLSDVDCFYSSDFTPWMYDCTLKTTGTMQLNDGSSWQVNTRHKWRLTFDDDSSVEFWLFKHPAREQDSEVVDLDTEGSGEKIEMYEKLRDRLGDEVKTTLVTKVEISR